MDWGALWTWAQNLAKGPATPTALLSAVVLGVLALLRMMVVSAINNQKEIMTTLANHFQHDQESLAQISDHMGATNEILRALSEEVLKAALRAPDTVAVHIPVDSPPSEVTVEPTGTTSTGGAVGP